MKTNTRTSIDFLDILFENRNKAYGAYELRRSYPKRLLISLGSTAVLVVLFYMGYLMERGNSVDIGRAIKPFVDVVIDDYKPQEKIAVPPPKAPPSLSPKTETKKHTSFLIVPDKQVGKEDMPPQIDELEHARIGWENLKGSDDDAITAPPTQYGTGVVETPGADEEQGMIPIEIESEYPGGIAAWRRYLGKTLRYPEAAVEMRIEGTVVVQFIVDNKGNVSEVAAISGPMELREEAERVIRRSGKWSAAIQNGRSVKSYKKQPIVFQLARE